MNIKQIKWIFEKAIFLIKTYENKKLSDKDFKDMTEYAKKAVKDSKNNEFCSLIMRMVLECFDKEDGNESGYKRTKEKHSKACIGCSAGSICRNGKEQLAGNSRGNVPAPAV